MFTVLLVTEPMVTTKSTTPRPCSEAWDRDVDLIEADKIRLQVSVQNLRVNAADEHMHAAVRRAAHACAEKHEHITGLHRARAAITVADEVILNPHRP